MSALRELLAEMPHALVPYVEFGIGQQARDELAGAFHRIKADAKIAARQNAETVAGLQQHARAVEGDRARLVKALESVTKDVRAWDLASDAFGEDLRDFVSRPFGPNRKASDRCESGKRDYCSCDLCF